jgi:hypothetical protein
MGYQLIETIEVGSDTSSVDILSIPQDGVDLLLKISCRNYSTGSHNLEITVNDNIASNVISTYLLGTGSSAISGSYSARSYVLLPGGNTPNSATSNTFSNAEFYISNYTSSSAKSASADAVNENNATSAYASINAISIGTTSGITKLTISNFAAENSTFSLYKITAD